MEVTHFRHAHRCVGFSVEASHPPAPILFIEISTYKIGAGDRLLLKKLFIFQRSFDVPLFLASSYCLTFVLLFLSADDRDGELQCTSAIIHCKGHYCQSLLAFGARNMRDFFLREQEPAGALGVVALGR